MKKLIEIVLYIILFVALTAILLGLFFNSILCLIGIGVAIIVSLVLTEFSIFKTYFERGRK